MSLVIAETVLSTLPCRKFQKLVKNPSHVFVMPGLVEHLKMGLLGYLLLLCFELRGLFAYVFFPCALFPFLQ